MTENTFKKKKQKVQFFKFLEKTINLDSDITADKIAQWNPTRYIPHLIFLAMLGIVYIGNAHYGERMVRQTTKLEADVENLRSDYATLKAQFDSYTGKQVNIAESAKKLGLQESKGKIQKIIIRKGEY
jgi:Bacteriodetes cell division protein (FtsL-like)